jgi:cytochrome d ubiquinol oxidase subunit II
MFELDLNITWYLLLGFLLIGYAILDGFDFGVGILHLFSRGDTERRTLLNAIGPVWDGNEVWLVTAGGALFAAFPHAYATVFSGFYLAMMLLLFALIFRAVAIEFRSKEPYAWWRQTWDIAFSLGSFFAAFVLGAAVGNLILGVPIGEDMEYQGGGLFALLSPYAVLVGLFSVATFAMHGAIYLYLKTEGELQAKTKRWIGRSYAVFVVMYAITTTTTLVMRPNMIPHFTGFGWAWIVAILNVLAVLNIPRALFLDLPFRAFISSCCSIAALIFLFGIGMFPNLVTSSLDPDFSLTLTNAASQKTLGIMLTIAILGVPFVIAYTVSIYWVFRGKVEIDRFSY